MFGTKTKFGLDVKKCKVWMYVVLAVVVVPALKMESRPVACEGSETELITVHLSVNFIKFEKKHVFEKL